MQSHVFNGAENNCSNFDISETRRDIIKLRQRLVCNIVCFDIVVALSETMPNSQSGSLGDIGLSNILEEAVPIGTKQAIKWDVRRF